MNFQKVLPHLIALLIFFVAVFFSFSPAFSGKVLQQGDKMAYLANSKEARDYKDDTGERALWSNTTFGGMPTYQTSAISEGNLTRHARRIFMGVALPYPADIFFLSMLCMYLALVLLGVNPWLSIVGALAFSLVSNNIILFETGHNTKLRVTATFPLIMAGIIMVWRKRYIPGGLVFALGMSFSLLSNHVQMLYYFGLTVPIFGLGMIIYSAKNGDWQHFGKSLGILLIGLLLSLGAASNNVLPSLEYGRQTMRGKPILKKPANKKATSSSETEGLEWTYAMKWSNNYEDVLATVIPRAAGGGSGEMISKDTPFGKAFSRIGARLPAEFQAPTYHGGQSFTSGPRYLGAVMWFFFILGLFSLKGPAKWWFGIGMLFAVFLSMGINAAWLNRFMYEYIPMFNQIRAPSSVFDSVGILVAGMAMLGLHAWIKQLNDNKEVAKKQLIFASATALGSLILIYLIGPSIIDFASPTDASSMQRMIGQSGTPEIIGTLVGALESTRESMFKADALRTLLFMALSGVTAFLFWRGTIKLPIFAAILAVLVMVDITGVSGRYLQNKDYKPKRAVAQSVEPDAADKQILADKDLYYRVYNTTVPDPFQDAMTSYLHKSIGGYHAAKLQRYQDLIDRHLLKGNQAVFNMLNTKYYIINGPQGKTAQRNPNALGNAWLVSNIKTVNSPNEEIDAMKDGFNPATTAIVHSEFSNEVANINPNGQGSIQLTNYSPMELKYSFNSSSEQLAVFSEIWYGPDLGWKATIDGEPAELIRVNYALRGLKVPAGQHEIVMSFNPSSYTMGFILSLVCSSLILFGLLAYFFLEFRKQKSDAPATQSTQKAVVTEESKPEKTGKRKAKK